MSREKTFTEEMKSGIKELVDKNYTLNGIREELKEKGICTYDRATINKYIGDKDGLNRERDKTSKSWVVKELNVQTEVQEIVPPAQVSMGDDQNFIVEVEIPLSELKEKSNVHSKTDSTDTTPKPPPSTHTEDHPVQHSHINPPPPSDDIKQILDICYLIKNEVKNLSSRINSLEKHCLELKDDLAKNKQQNKDVIYSLASEFITIYSSEKNKKSIYINNKIIGKIVEKMKNKPYNIEDNDSLAINTALLMALYRKEEPEVSEPAIMKY